MKRLRRLWDQWRHPGELPTQREYRRWRAFLEATTPSHGPYVLSSVREVREVTLDDDGVTLSWHRE